MEKTEVVLELACSSLPDGILKHRKGCWGCRVEVQRWPGTSVSGSFALLVKGLLVKPPAAECRVLVRPSQAG